MFRKFSIFILFTILLLHLAADLSEGLILYYPFDGNANDESGNGENGTIYGPSLTYDRFGNENSAYEFNGTSDYIAITKHYQDGDSIEKCTFVGWYKTSFSGGTYSSNW